MKRILIILAAVFLISCAKQVRIYDEEKATNKEPTRIEEPIRNIQLGEKLVYAVDWIGIPAGQITIETKEITLFFGQPAYHIVAKATPNKFFKFFHDVEYTVHSYIAAESLKTLKFHKERLLNGNFTEEDINFNYGNNEISWSYSNPRLVKMIAMPLDNQDLLSALYSFRIRDIRIGESYKMNIVYGGDIWPLDIILEKTEDIQIAGSGHFKTAVVKLFSKLNDHITGFNNIQIYLSLDKKRLPVLFKMRTKIGYLSGVLISYQ